MHFLEKDNVYKLKRYCLHKKRKTICQLSLHMLILNVKFFLFYLIVLNYVARIQDEALFLERYSLWLVTRWQAVFFCCILQIAKKIEFSTKNLAVMSYKLLNISLFVSVRSKPYDRYFSYSVVKVISFLSVHI